MKSKIVFIILLSAYSIQINAQESEIINPKGKWFLGPEIGLNAITSIHSSRMTSFQGGLLAEYYFAKNWSVSGRIKYFETGVLYNDDPAKGYFEGAVISVPLNIIWKYRIFKNFSGNFKLGFAVNQEVKSNYFYPPNVKTDYSKFYGTFNPGLGFSYFLSPKTAVFLNYESYVLGPNRNENALMKIVGSSPNNNLFNIGVKYNFAD